MLEHNRLLILGWTKQLSTDRTSNWQRRITTPEGALLGLVRLVHEPLFSWLPWIRRLRLQLLETDDLSHTMTLLSSWGFSRAWDVLDSEENAVGRFGAAEILNSINEYVGTHKVASELEGLILSPARAILATYRRLPDACLEITFDATSINPFLRMLIVGCALTNDVMPNRD